MSEADVDGRLAAAATAHASYRLTSFEDRAGWMRRAAGILDDEQEQAAAMMTTEMGKTLTSARQEGAKGVGARRLYGDHAASVLANEAPGLYAAGSEGAQGRLQPL